MIILGPPPRLAHIWPTSGNIWWDSGQMWSIPDQVWLKVAELGSTLVDSKPNLADVGPNLALAPNLVDAGPRWSLPGQIWPKPSGFGRRRRFRARFGRFWANAGRARGRTGPKFGRFCAELADSGRRIGPRPNFRRHRPGVGRVSAISTTLMFAKVRGSSFAKLCVFALLRPASPGGLQQIGPWSSTDRAHV